MHGRIQRPFRSGAQHLPPIHERNEEHLVHVAVQTVIIISRR